MTGPVSPADLTALSQSPGLPRLTKTTDLSAARKAAQDFEAVFVSQMLGQMFAGVKTDGLFGGGHGEEMFRTMLFDEYGKQIAKHGGFGIADAVLRQLVAVQEKTP
jgi:Rod binding domain-containing protein